MPQYGQSPWAEAGAGMENVGGSMARIALAQQIGRQRAQQFMQQQALNQAYLRLEQEKQQSAMPEMQARTGLYNAQTAKANQDVIRQGTMDDLAQAVAGNMFQKQVPGGVSNLLAGGVGQNTQTIPGASPTNVGPTMQNAQALNQGDLVRNAYQLMGMNDPNSLERLIHGVNIPKGAENVNQLTGEQTMGPEMTMSDYQRQALALRQQGLDMQGRLGQRRLDSQDQMNLAKIQQMVNNLHKGLAEVYNKEGELDKAKAELDQIDSGTPEEQSDGSKQDDIKGVGKPLDPATAKQFLQQAGGDKDKARQLAKQAGYSF